MGADAPAPTAPTSGPTAADGMILAGAVVALVAFGVLVGFWPAVLVFGICLAVAGVLRSRVE